MLTYDQIAVMTKEQLLSTNFRDLWGPFQDMECSTNPVHKEASLKIKEMFAKPVDHWTQRIRLAYDTKEEGVAALASAFSKEPALIQIMVWGRVTGGGIDQIDYAKYVHKHFANAILNLFGAVSG